MSLDPVELVHKAFGRHFFIASFFPSLLFVAIVAILAWGLPASVGTIDLKSLVDTWAKKSWKELGFAAALPVIGAFILAYVLYGMRDGLRQTFEGNWPFFPGRVKGQFIKLQRYEMSKRLKKLEAAAESLSVFHWINQSKFGATYSTIRLCPEQAQTKLEKTQQNLDALEEKLADKQQVDTNDVWLLLSDGMVLQGNSETFPDPTKGNIREFVSKLSACYESHSGLKKVTQSLEGIRHKEYLEAQQASSDFPDDELWLRPTLLGNIASVQETYSLKRYGITLSQMWPRLAVEMDQKVHRHLEDAVIYRDFATTVSFLSLVAAVVVISATFGDYKRGTGLHTVPPALLVLNSWVFYRLAIHATRALGAQIRATVDLFQLRVIDALGIKRPQTLAETKNLWTKLGIFWMDGTLPSDGVQIISAAPSRASEKEAETKTENGG